MPLLPELSVRRREAEWMDEPGADPKELADALKFIRRVNAWLGYTRATLSHLERFSRGWPRGRSITIVDLATGSADVPLEIVRWSRGRGWDVRVVGVDLHESTVEAARQATAGEPTIKIVRGDALDLPFAAGSFDYAMTSMFLHHLSDEQVVRVLREMDRVARRGVLAADLLRHRRAYGWISLLTLLSNRMVRHDARVSVAQAFTRDEVLALRDRAQLPYLRFSPHFGHRFVLAGEKSQPKPENGRA